MRWYIFGFSQEILNKFRLSVGDSLILDYLIDFYHSENCCIKNIDNKRFMWISFSKLIADLPILNIGERQVRRLLSKFEEKGIIKKYQENGKSFVYINEDLLFGKQSYYACKVTEHDLNLINFYKKQNELNQNKIANGDNGNVYKDNGDEEQGGQKCPYFDDKADILVKTDGQKCPIIVKYYKNKIKLLCDDARMQKIDCEDFVYELKAKLKIKLRPITYDICISNMDVCYVGDKCIILDVGSATILRLNTNNVFFETVCETLQKCLNNIT